MSKKALLVGCNYPGTDSELRGCVNDVINMKDFLINQRGYQSRNIMVLVDTSSSRLKRPTGENIRRALNYLVSTAKAGDSIAFHYSGHGTQVQNQNRLTDDEKDKKDEAIVPTDFNLITDDDLRTITQAVPFGVSFTMVFDCCHSGTILDFSPANRIIAGKNKAIKSTGLPSGSRSRQLTPAQIVAGLNKKYHKILGTDATASTIDSSLVKIFGSSASPKYTAIHKGGVLVTRSKSRAAPYFLLPHKKSLDKGILITGCEEGETSADVPGPSGSYGALTKYLLDDARKNAAISNFDLVTSVRANLARSHFTQSPCLECTRAQAAANFMK